jgi:hypothetical protein
VKRRVPFNLPKEGIEAGWYQMLVIRRSLCAGTARISGHAVISVNHRPRRACRKLPGEHSYLLSFLLLCVDHSNAFSDTRRSWPPQFVLAGDAPMIIPGGLYHS